MSLYDDASLIITPNAYKTSKLYSIKPIDGSGDLSVVRATTATYVDADGLIKTALANEVRFDYTNGSCPSILVEPQRTNLLLRSEEFDNASWGKLNATVIANSTISPNGGLNADTITSNLTTGFISQGTSAVIGTPYTLSIYIKNINASSSAFLGRTTLNNYSFGINWNGQTISSITSIIGATSYTSVGNGWYRIVCVFNSLEASILNRIYSDNTTINKSVAVWGAQLEAGANATSYIPTVASTVTRNADGNNIILTNKSFWNKNNFTIYWEGTFLYGATNQATFGFGNAAHIISGNATMCFYNNGVGFFRKQDGTSPEGLTIGTPLPNGSNYKLIIKREGTEIKWFRNGVLLGVRTGEVVDYTYLGLNSGGSTYYLNKSFMIPSSLTDQECIDLTTL